MSDKIIRLPLKQDCITKDFEIYLQETFTQMNKEEKIIVKEIKVDTRVKKLI